MKLANCSLPLVLSLAILVISGCANKDKTTTAPLEETAPPPQEKMASGPEQQAPSQLPVRFQNMGYLAADQQADEELEDTADEYQLKVGATIRSTAGPQPLWDIVSRLASLKGMSVSWASDVNRDLLVDVNISPEDNFSDALDNLLRQLDYFHEIKGNTIFVGYKESRIFHLALPYMKGNYNSTVGGDFLPQGDAGNTTNTQGTAQITSSENEFDIWQNIRSNLDLILQQEYATVNQPETPATTAEQTSNENDGEDEAPAARSTQRRSPEDPYYFIDQSAGLITITASKSMLERFEVYFETLKKELYRQVVIEAKIVEVYLQDNSKIGLDWSSVLKDFEISGTTFFGGSSTDTTDGTVFPWSSEINESTGDNFTRFVSKITLDAVDFSVVLNALNEQGDASVLSNPKLTVLNGQPAIISIAKNITYIKEVTREDDSDDNSTTYSAEPGQVSEGVALGVIASIIDDDNVIMHLTPITTELEDGEIDSVTFSDGSIIGLPIVNVREMSTMVQVRNGEMLIIGGLIDSVESTEGAFAPVVGNIPIIKYLFGYEEKILQKRELVILLTPRII